MPIIEYNFGWFGVHHPQQFYGNQQYHRSTQSSYSKHSHQTLGLCSQNLVLSKETSRVPPYLGRIKTKTTEQQCNNTTFVSSQTLSCGFLKPFLRLQNQEKQGGFAHMSRRLLRLTSPLGAAFQTEALRRMEAPPRLGRWRAEGAKGHASVSCSIRSRVAGLSKHVQICNCQDLQ